MPAPKTRLEHLLEAVPDALVGLDQEGVIRFVNRQTEELFGYDRDQLIGRPIEMAVPEPLWQIYSELRTDYFADPRTRSRGLELELYGRHQDGSQFPINVTLSTIDTGDVLLAITAVRDVTLRKRAIEGAQLIAAIVEYSEDAIIGVALDGIITSWNLAAQKMYGYSSREMVGQFVGRLTPQDRVEENKTILARIKAGEHIEDFETERVRKDTTVFPVSLTLAPVRDSDGAIVGASAVHRDHSEQKGLLVAAQRMAAIVQYCDEAIIGGTLDGIVTSWNPAAAEMFGYSSQEIVGKSIDLVRPQDRADEMSAVRAKISAGLPVRQLDRTGVRKDGTRFPVSLTISPIRDQDRVVVAASVICRDVTGLRDEAQYARSLLEAALDPIVTISPDGKITDVNEATVSAVGLPRDKLIGTDFSQYFSDPDKASRLCRLAIARGDVVDYPLTMRHVDGTTTEVVYNVSVYRDARGQVTGTIAAARDVTRQMQASGAAAQQRAGELERLAELERFLQLTVGHELTTNELKKATQRLTTLGRASSDDPGGQGQG